MLLGENGLGILMKKFLPCAIGRLHYNAKWRLRPQDVRMFGKTGANMSPSGLWRPMLKGGNCHHTCRMHTRTGAAVEFNMGAWGQPLDGLNWQNHEFVRNGQKMTNLQEHTNPNVVQCCCHSARYWHISIKNVQNCALFEQKMCLEGKC